jgi:hypothetical protein
MFPCPVCGKPDSAYDDSFCGECEGKYWEEQERHRQDEISFYENKISNCRCRESGEPCSGCYHALAMIQYAKGNEAEGDYWLNH